MGRVKITNLTDKTICLNLETNDLGKGLMYVNLDAGASRVVDDSELSEQIKGLALRRRSRDPALSLEALVPPKNTPVEPGKGLMYKNVPVEDPEPTVEPPESWPQPKEVDEDAEEFLCEFCDKTYTTQQVLNTHVRTHEDE